MHPILYLLFLVQIGSSQSSVYVDSLLAEVNGRIITLSDLLFEKEISRIENEGREEDGDASLEETLEKLIEFNILLTFAEKNKAIKVDEEEVLLSFQEFKKKCGETPFLTLLKKWDIGEEDLLEYFRKRFLIDRYIKMRVELYATVSDREVKRILKERGRDIEALDSEDAIRKVSESLRQERFKKRYAELIEELKRNSKIRIFKDLHADE